MKIALLRAEYEELKHNEGSARPTVVAYGLMNSGKSSLLNMLTNNVEQEFFKTNDVRETVENRTFNGEHYMFVDTPGLDANEEDDAHAKDGAEKADVVLFVHQPQGALEAVEMAFLRKLVSSFGSFAPRHVVLVLTKIEKEESSKIEQIERDILRQCEAEFGFAPMIFNVSNKRYQTGVLKSQPALMALSGMPALDAYLTELAPSAAEPRAQRIKVKIASLLSDVERADAEIQRQKAKIRAQIFGSFSAFNQQIENLHHFLDASVSSFKRI